MAPLTLLMRVCVIQKSDICIHMYVLNIHAIEYLPDDCQVVNI